jgi:hypothetical protein
MKSPRPSRPPAARRSDEQPVGQPELYGLTTDCVEQGTDRGLDDILPRMQLGAVVWKSGGTSDTVATRSGERAWESLDPPVPPHQLDAVGPTDRRRNDRRNHEACGRDATNSGFYPGATEPAASESRTLNCRRTTLLPSARVLHETLRRGMAGNG